MSVIRFKSIPMVDNRIFTTNGIAVTINREKTEPKTSANGFYLHVGDIDEIDKGVFDILSREVLEFTTNINNRTSLLLVNLNRDLLEVCKSVVSPTYIAPGEVGLTVRCELLSQFTKQELVDLDYLAHIHFIK